MMRRGFSESWRGTTGLQIFGCITPVHVYRGERVQQDRCDDILSHQFQHQTHHCGQVHALLSGTTIKPPQLDEFIVGDDAGLRKSEMEALEHFQQKRVALLRPDNALKQ